MSTTEVAQQTVNDTTAVRPFDVAVPDAALSELREFVFKFAAKNSCDAKRSQIVRVHWRIQAITTQISQWIHFAQGRDKFCGETRGRVHRQINRDQFCSSNRGLIKGLSGKIEANEVVPSLA